MAHPYLWIVVVGGIVGFMAGCGGGANDLANSFGTTYGARVLTLPQIVVVAAICEFTGAISLGAQVTSTLASGIANPMLFSDEPYVLMYGMLCAIGAAVVWLSLATALTLPVSSTHSIAGGIMGFALVYGGGGGVYWAKPINDFPFVKGVAPIIASWFISPVLTGAVAAVMFILLRQLVLRPKNAAVRATYTLPFIVAVTFFLEAFLILFKGASKRLKWSVGRAAWVAACIGVGAGLLTIPFVPLLQRRLRQMREKAEREAVNLGRPVEDVEAEFAAGMRTVETGNSVLSDELETARPQQEGGIAAVENDDAAVYNSAGQKDATARSESECEDAANKSVAMGRVEIGTEPFGETAVTAEEESNVVKKHIDVELFDPAVEYVYRYLQVFTAICMSFAHGANDVSNSVGPFAAIYDIYSHQKVRSSVEVHIWILVLGGTGIVVGLATFGLRVMRLMGEKITTITPTRGFIIELATALVVSFASGYGIPVSTTHSVTGAVVFISLVDVGVRNVKWLLVLKMYAGWVFTLVITASVSAALFAQGVYAPARM